MIIVMTIVVVMITTTTMTIQTRDIATAMEKVK